MSRTNAAETDYLLLMFNNVDWEFVGDTAGLQASAGAGDLFISLHTADPGETGDQETNEATFGSYGRVSVARTGSEWVVSGNNASNVNAIPFTEASSGSETITHVGIGTDSSGAGNLIWFGILDTARLVNTGITIQFAANELDINAD